MLKLSEASLLGLGLGLGLEEEVFVFDSKRENRYRAVEGSG